MRICVISEGSSIHTQRYCRDLASTGHEIHLASPQAVSIHGVTVHVTPFYAPGVRPRLRTLRRARRILERIAPDVYHLYGLFALASLSTMLVARSLSPLVISLWGTDIMPPGETETWKSRAVKSYLLSRAVEVNAVVGFLARKAETYMAPDRKADTVYEGVDLSLWRPRDEPRTDGEVRLGFAKALHSLSGPDFLLSAYARAREICPIPFFLWVAGDGPMEKELKDQAARLQLGDSVRWLGKIHGTAAMADFFRSVDFTAMPSRREGIGMSAVEAQACGLAVTGFATGGLPETVAHGETGLLVPTGDVEALALAFARLAGDSDLRARMGRAARVRAQALFSKDRQMENMLAIYRAVSGRGAAPCRS